MRSKKQNGHETQMCGMRYGRCGGCNLRKRNSILSSITLSIFSVFSMFYLGDRFKWNYGVGFSLIVAAAFFIFHKW